MLSRCKEFGADRILWRMFDAGYANYNSAYADKFKFCKNDGYTFHTLFSANDEDFGFYKEYDHYDSTMPDDFDTLKVASTICRDLGLEIYAWYSINEDDHGCGLTSRFTREHPEFRWVRRNGERYHSQLSFAFPEVRAYKLNLIKESFQYDIDGLFLDYMRTGDVRDDPQTDKNGYADYGYEKPFVDEYLRRYNVDPHDVPADDEKWLDLRNESITEFMREVRREVDENRPDFVIDAMGVHPYSYRGMPDEQKTDDAPDWLKKFGLTVHGGSKKSLLCDVETWAKEKLIDKFIVAAYYRKGYTLKNALSYAKELIEDTPVKLMAYSDLPNSAEKVYRFVSVAKEFGISELLFWEADWMDTLVGNEFEAVSSAVKKIKE